MKKQKRNTVSRLLLISLLALALVFSGCAQKDPIERLEIAFERSAAMQTATQTLDMQMFFDSSEESSEFDMIKNMLDGMKITGRIDVDQKAMDFAGVIKVELQGMSYEIELYKGEQYFLKMPLFDKYLVIMDKEQTAEFFNQELMDSLNNDMMQVILSRLNQSNTEARSEIEIEQEGSRVKVTPIAINLSDDEAKEIFAELMDFIFNNPQMQDQMKDNMRMQMEMAGLELSEEEIEEMTQEASAQMDQTMQMMRRAISIDSLQSIYYLDKHNDIRKAYMDYAIKLDLGALASDMMAGTQGELSAEDLGIETPTLTLRFVGTTDVLNINKPLVINMPELTPDNSVGMNDLAALPF